MIGVFIAWPARLFRLINSIKSETTLVGYIFSVSVYVRGPDLYINHPNHYVVGG